MVRSSTNEQLRNGIPSPEEIRKRAFEIHIERGGIHGCDPVASRTRTSAKVQEPTKRAAKRSQEVRMKTEILKFQPETRSSRFPL
jgi:hypothetical protein